MAKVKNDLKTQAVLNNILKKAKAKKIIKPINDAFKDIPVHKEIHKGKKEYFNN